MIQKTFGLAEQKLGGALIPPPPHHLLRPPLRQLGAGEAVFLQFAVQPLFGCSALLAAHRFEGGGPKVGYSPNMITELMDETLRAR